MSGAPRDTSSSYLTRFRALIDECESYESGQLTSADSLAKAAYLDPNPVLPHSQSITRAKRGLKSRFEASVASYWSENAPSKYQLIGPGPNTKVTTELRKISQRSLGLLLVTHSGHGDFVV